VGFEFSTLCFLGRCSSSSSMPKLFLLQLFFKKGLVLLPWLGLGTGFSYFLPLF
jgi:hypothetical protein